MSSHEAPQSDHPEMPRVEQVEAVLRRHVLDVWFPRCLDMEHGGFLCDFDRRWKPCGPHEKLMEFQSRQTLVAAEASRLYPDDDRLRNAARHGFRYLRDAMWDGQAGGWFHRVDRAGKPLEWNTKHVHGAAYGIQASVAVHEAIGEPGALDLAREGFEWLERHAHDHEHGGYFGFLTQANTVIREPSQCPKKMVCDPVNTPIGYKDANVNSDLLEAFGFLYRAWPDGRVKKRLVELADIVSNKLLGPGGVHFFCEPDWTPVPHLSRYGYEFMAANRLIMVRDLVGDKGEMKRIALRAVDHAMQNGWDRNGGFYYAGPGTAPTWIEGRDLIVRRKSWWVQAEAIKTLMTVTHLEPDNEHYRRHFTAQWQYIQSRFLDARYGGVYTLGSESLSRWRRHLGAAFAPSEYTRKGSDWKDASHDGRALLHCVRTLRGNTRPAAQPHSEEFERATGLRSTT